MVLIGLFKDFPNVPVFIGGCIDRGRGSSFRRKAHAHISGCTNAGFICVRSIKRVFMRDGIRPSHLMIHELAHIVSNQGHTDKWRKTVHKLGGHLNYWEKKKKKARFP